MARHRTNRDELEASPLTIQELIKDRNHIYHIPRFQRSYCWDQSNIQMLWEDIDSLASEADTLRFLGAIILKDKTLAGGKKNPAFDVIDGQQRLVTFFVLLCVLTQQCYQYATKLSSESENQSEIDFGSELAESATEVAEGLLIGSGKDKGKPKIVPSFVDMPEFNWALQYLNFTDLSPKQYELHGQAKAGSLEIATELIFDMLADRVTAAGVGFQGSERLYEACKYLHKTLEIVTSELELIEVILADRHDANEVFDRLNLQGQELTVLDLMRNELFRVFGADDDSAIDFYKTHWRKFEEQFVTPMEHLRDPDNMQPFVNAVAKHKSGFWYPFALMIDSDCTSSKKKIFDTLRSHWGKIETSSATKKALKILAELNEYVPIYNAITLGQRPSNIPEKSDIWRKVRRIHEYRCPAGTYVYMFKIVRAGLSAKDRQEITNICECLDLVESYIMRRAFCKDDGSVKNVFNTIWNIIGTDPTLLNFQLHDKNRPFYEDSTVIDALKSPDTGNFYVLKDRAKFALLEYERSLKGDDPEDPRLITVDHIMPRKREPNWTQVTKKDHERYVDTLGNLVVLTRRSNSSKNNRSWKETKTLFNDESATKSPRKLGRKKNWTVADIKKRTDELSKWMVGHWSKPKKPPTKLSDELRNRMEAEQNQITVRLSQANIEHAFIRKTKTGHNKANITATKEIQDFLRQNGIHDFSKQAKGEKNKVRVPVSYYYEDLRVPADLSLLRTTSKNECRIWASGLNDYSGQWSILALHVDDKRKVTIVNCSNPSNLDAFIRKYGT